MQAPRELWKRKVALPQREKRTWRVPETMRFPAGVVRRGLRQQMYPPVQVFPLVLDYGSEHWREDWMPRRPRQGLARPQLLLVWQPLSFLQTQTV